MREDEFGGLKVRILGGNDREGDLDTPGGPGGPVVVLLHGFGAPGTDLIPIWRVLDVPHPVRFVFPEAPVSLASSGYGAGRAWWMLDLEGLERRARGEDVPDRSGELPEGLEPAREQLDAMMTELQSRMAVGPERIVLGGFSQGSMLACDWAVQSGAQLAGLVLLSSTLIARERWVAGMPSLAATPVLQTHGTEDPLLPLEAAEQLRDLLREAGVDVAWHAFRGGHELPGMVLAELAAFITARLS